LNKVQELTLSPSLIAHNVASVWRWSVTDTLCFTFPLLFPAAAYACKVERQFRRELVTLALLFPMLMAAYLFQSESSSSFDGERYYYEGYAALCIVAARGVLLLVSRWRVRRQAAWRGLLALGLIHLLFIVVMVRDVEARLAPWRMAYRASVAEPRPTLVFLGGTQAAFASKHANWNEARWRTEPIIFLNDPGAGRRDAVACRFQKRAYRVVTYDVAARRAFTSDVATRCGDTGR
jgi:peptidoglycan/LPS O-acetylase OafA/YrhL